MRTVNYLTSQSFARRRTTARVGDVFLARSRSHWMATSPLPLVRPVSLYHPALPAVFEGLRIVQVSDVHAGTFMPPERLSRVRELVTALEPELVVFTGDQLDRRDVDADIFVHGFAGIEAPLGVFGVLGNHDHLAGSDLAVAALEAVGITPLVNQAATLRRNGTTLDIVGIDDIEAPAGWGPDFTVLRRSAADFRIALCHQPNAWAEAWTAGADLTLAGHTHGGQIALPTRIINVARLMTPYIVGPYLRDDALLYVSRGVGVGAVPLRWGAPPEIDLITLRRGPAAAF
jgi:uncharacterized protein